MARFPFGLVILFSTVSCGGTNLVVGSNETTDADGSIPDDGSFPCATPQSTTPRALGRSSS